VADTDTTASLGDKLSVAGAGLLGEALVGWIRGELSPQPQDEAKATYCQPINKDEGEIDWHQPAIEIWRRVRAFYPWPGSYSRWRGKTLKVTEAALSAAATPAKAGEVVALGSGFGIGTGEGTLGVLRVQLEGKQVLSAAEFLRGQRGFIGAVLPSS